MSMTINAYRSAVEPMEITRRWDAGLIHFWSEIYYSVHIKSSACFIIKLVLNVIDYCVEKYM